MSENMTGSEYLVFWKVQVAGSHRPTGKTVHYSGGNILPSPSGLQIAQYPGDDGYYLFYLDENGEEITDTFHDDVRGAMEQAEWEFDVKPSEWEKVE